MSEIKATSPYLNIPTMSRIERLADDARKAGLSVTMSADCITVTGGLVIPSSKALQIILDASNGLDHDEAIRKRQGEACERRALANTPWPICTGN